MIGKKLVYLLILLSILAISFAQTDNQDDVDGDNDDEIWTIEEDWTDFLDENQNGIDDRDEDDYDEEWEDDYYEEDNYDEDDYDEDDYDEEWEDDYYEEDNYDEDDYDEDDYDEDDYEEDDEEENIESWIQELVSEELIFENDSHSLADYEFTKVNDIADRTTKYFKNQPLPTDWKSQYTDYYFNPNIDNIMSVTGIGEYTDPHQERRAWQLEGWHLNRNEVEWKRAKDILGDDVVLFDHSIEVHDAKQGFLGNCYLISAFSALAQHPQQILQLFKGGLTISHNGLYQILMKIDGVWQIVIVDDYLPVWKKTGNLIFAKPNGNEIWLLLIEKAWAKVNGGYSNTIGGSSDEVLKAFTNLTFSSFYHEDLEDVFEEDYNEYVSFMWDVLESTAIRDDIINSGSVHENQAYNGDSSISRNGILLGHEYAVIDARTVTLLNGEEAHLVKLYNPWGSYEYTGPWNVFSEEWTDELIEELGLEIQDDGMFWMEFTEYLDHFMYTSIFYREEQMISKSVTIDSTEANLGHVLELNILVESEITISGVTASWRFNRNIYEDWLTVDMFLIKKNDCDHKVNPQDCVTYIADGGYFVDVYEILEPGTYWLYVYTPSHNAVENMGYDKMYDYTIIVHSDEFFDLAYKHIDEDHTLARLGLLDYATSLKAATLDQKDPIYTSKVYWTNSSNIGFFAILNKATTDQRFKVEGSPDNYHIIYPKEKPDKIKLKPGHGYVFVLGLKDLWEDDTEINYRLERVVKTESEPTYRTLTKLLTPSKEADFAKYSDDHAFIFKEMDLDYNAFIQGLSLTEANAAFIEAKYPGYIGILNQLEKLDDGVETIFRDIYWVDEVSWILGEYSLETGMLHGRIIYYLGDGDYIVTYAVDGRLQGDVLLVLPSYEKVGFGHIEDGVFYLN